MNDFDVSKAQCESMIEPHSMSDDFGRKSVAVIVIWAIFHRSSISQTS